MIHVHLNHSSGKLKTANKNEGAVARVTPSHWNKAPQKGGSLNVVWFEKMTVMFNCSIEALVLFSACHVKTPWNGKLLCAKRMGVVTVVLELEGHPGVSGSKPHKRERGIPLAPNP